MILIGVLALPAEIKPIELARVIPGKELRRVVASLHLRKPLSQVDVSLNLHFS